LNLESQCQLLLVQQQLYALAATTRLDKVTSRNQPTVDARIEDFFHSFTLVGAPTTSTYREIAAAETLRRAGLRCETRVIHEAIGGRQFEFERMISLHANSLSHDDQPLLGKIALLPALESLRSVDCELDQHTFSLLSNLTHLKELDLTRCDLLGIDPAPLRALKALEILRLVKSSINNSTIRAIGQLPHLRTLQLGYHPSLSDSDLTIIGRLTSLKDLSVSSNGISDAGVRELQQLTNLR
jgi:hypothetical protein